MLSQDPLSRTGTAKLLEFPALSDLASRDNQATDLQCSQSLRPALRRRAKREGNNHLSEHLGPLNSLR